MPNFIAKKTVKELLENDYVGMYEDIEFYRFKFDIEQVMFEECVFTEEYDENECVGEYYLMGEIDYNHYFGYECMDWNFEDLYGNKDANVLVVVLFREPYMDYEFPELGLCWDEEAGAKGKYVERKPKKTYY